jgi:hypothetical protein
VEQLRGHTAKNLRHHSDQDESILCFSRKCVGGDVHPVGVCWHLNDPRIFRSRIIVIISPVQTGRVLAESAACGAKVNQPASKSRHRTSKVFGFLRARDVKGGQNFYLSMILWGVNSCLGFLAIFLIHLKPQHMKLIQHNISAVIALIIATFGLTDFATAAVAISPEHPSQVSPQGADFSAGFRAGYKKANPYGLCPLPPLPPLGKNTFEDGFGIGYAQGLLDKGS